MTDQPIRYWPIARCGSAIPHRTHRTADRPGYCVGNIGIIISRCPVCGGTHESVSCSGVDIPRSRTMEDARIASALPGTGCIGEACDGCRYCDR